ncbi:MAG TPA: hypothetical protein VF807_04255, partial [Ktedonobacterales bacterium]
ASRQQWKGLYFVPLPVTFGILIFAPLVLGIVLYAIGASGVARPRLAAGLAIAGALIPLILFAALSTSWLNNVPLRTSLFGNGSGQAWWTPALQLDDFAMWGALGVMVFIGPLVLWLAWRGGFAVSQSAGGDEASQTATEDATDTSLISAPAQPLARERWQGLSVALAIESAALAVCFGDGVGWVALWWLVLVALVWLLGELGTAASSFDRISAVALALGPILWFVTMLVVGNGGGSYRVSDLMGTGKTNLLGSILPELTIALAAGLYPFLGWVRRRAQLTPPAGLAALLVGVLPAALFIGGRTFAALEDTSGLTARIGALTPPITTGIVWVVLGAVSIAISGLLSLGTRNARALLANLAIAQGGWALMALGISLPAAIYGYVMLLATMVVGLGAMIASQVAGGTLKADYELDGAGPRPFGLATRPLNLLIWSIGAASLIGLPLFAGFDPRHLISSSTLKASQLVIPLVGFAWAGDVLFAIALLRFLAPAFANWEPVAIDRLRSAGWWRLAPEDVPGALLAAIALVAGIASPGFLALGGHNVAGALLQSSLTQTGPSIGAYGYVTQVSQWLPGFAWIAALLLGAIVLLSLAKARVVVPAPQLAAEATSDGEDAPLELATLNEPDAAWSDLSRAFGAGVTVPGRSWLETMGPAEPAEDPPEEAADPDGDETSGSADAEREQQKTGGQA